jgi:hypothetical protein
MALFFSHFYSCALLLLLLILSLRVVLSTKVAEKGRPNKGQTKLDVELDRQVSGPFPLLFPQCEVKMSTRSYEKLVRMKQRGQKRRAA